MNNSLRRALLCGAATAALVSASSAAFASGGKETNWATIDNHGFLGIDLTVEGGYAFGSGKLPYAQFDNYDDGDSGYTFRTDPGDGWNGSVGIAGRFEGGWKLNLSYTGLRSSQDADTGVYNESNTTPSIDWPIDNILGPSSTSYNQITVETHIKADTFDLTIGHDVGLGSGNLTLIGGLRYGVYQQNTSTVIYCAKASCDPREVESTENRQSRYRGIGPQFGANYAMPIGDAGFGIFGSALGSVLYGKQKTTSTGAWGDSTTYSDNHVAYTADAKAGISYKLPNHPLEIAAGYSVSWLGRVRDTQNESSYTGDLNVGNRHDNLLYHGPFVKLTVSLP